MITGCRQEVTGLTVNAIANVSRKFIQELRWILNAWEKYGYARTYALFYPRYKTEKGYIKKGEPVMENVIGGKMDYLRMVRGANNAAYKKLQSRFDKLQQVVFLGTEDEQNQAKKFMYVQPYTMTEFKEYFHTEISLTVTKNGKLVGKCTIAGMEKTLAISHATQSFLCPEFKQHKEGDFIESEKLEKCHIILCRAKGKNYWMITNKDHKRDKMLSIQNVKINPDKLLDIWEKQGFKAAAEKLSLFIECGEDGDSAFTFENHLEEPNSLNDKKMNDENPDVLLFSEDWSSILEEIANRNDNIDDMEKVMEL